MSKSEDSTAVAGKLIKTDDSLQPSQDFFSTEDQKGSQLECAKNEDSLFSSSGSKLQREHAKNGSICCDNHSRARAATPAPSFACARRLDPLRRLHSRARALPQHTPAPSFVRTRSLCQLRRLDTRAHATPTYSDALIRVCAQARLTPAPSFA